MKSANEGEDVSFRLVHDIAEPEEELKVSRGSVYENRHHGVSRIDWDEDAPDASDAYLGFRLAADKEVK